MSASAQTSACKHRRDRATRKATIGYWKLVALGEPFRLLFPVGLAIGITGVLLWPLHIWNITTIYPGVSHARIMIEGFLGSFVAGFLGTAMPRLLGAPNIKTGETIAIAAGLVATTWLHASGRVFWGDQMFLFTLLALVYRPWHAGGRAQRHSPAGIHARRPGHRLGARRGDAFSGERACAHGTARLGRAARAVAALPGIPAAAGHGHQRVPAAPVFRPAKPPELRRVPDTATRLVAQSPVCPGLRDGGAGELRAGGFRRIQAGYALRALAFLVYSLRELPVHRAGIGGGTLALGARLALLSPPAGFALIVWQPAFSLSFLHVVYITGFSMLTLVVASRVVLGHSGQAKLFTAPLRSVLAMISLITLAMLTRVTADWLPDIRLSHYAYASISWILGSLIWAIAILPSVRLADTD